VYVGYKLHALQFDDDDDDGNSRYPTYGGQGQEITIKLGNTQIRGVREVRVPYGTLSIPIQVVPVLAQSYGSASCGYHALKNACAISSMLLGDKECEGWLLDSNVASQLFGLNKEEKQAGRWRQHIMRERNKLVLRGYIGGLMRMRPLNSIGGDRDVMEQLRNYFLKLRNDYIDGVVGRMVQDTDQGRVIVSLSDFMRWANSKSNSVQYSADEIRAFIDIDDAEQNVSLSDYTALLKYAYETYNCAAREHGSSTTTDGEWLHGGEVVQLYRDVVSKSECINLERNNVRVVVIDSVDKKFLDEVDEVKSIRAAIHGDQESSDKKRDPHIYAFVVGSMRYNGTGGSRGHWTTLVLDASQRNQRRYIVADSMGRGVGVPNSCRALIDYLESSPANGTACMTGVREGLQPQAPQRSCFARVCDYVLDWLDR
jgi:hypothetical protein